MDCDMKVTFRTPQPLSQETGLEFWSHASRFTSVPGRCTYQLTTRQSFGDLPEAIAAACDLIEKIVAREAFQWDGVVIDKIVAEVVV